MAKRGYTVAIIEKNSQAGGRLNQLKKDGFSFDTGPGFQMICWKNLIIMSMYYQDQIRAVLLKIQKVFSLFARYLICDISPTGMIKMNLQIG